MALPTEAQWEYACRAGTMSPYPWGDNPDDGKGWANCADMTLKQSLANQPDITFFSWNDAFEFTSPSGTFMPNAFGLYDMIGNAWQWCQDRYGDYRLGSQYHIGSATTDPGDPIGPGNQGVSRGGSWSSGPRYCRAACRLRAGPDNSNYNCGFRITVANDGD